MVPCSLSFLYCRWFTSKALDFELPFKTGYIIAEKKKKLKFFNSFSTCLFLQDTAYHHFQSNLHKNRPIAPGLSNVNRGQWVLTHFKHSVNRFCHAVFIISFRPVAANFQYFIFGISHRKWIAHPFEHGNII